MTGTRSCILIFLILIIRIKLSECYQWPTSIRRCTKNETNLNKCLLDAARIAIPQLAKVSVAKDGWSAIRYHFPFTTDELLLYSTPVGMKELGLRPLDPLRMGNMTVSSDRPPVSLSFRIVNGVLDGVSKMVLQKISYDPRKQEMVIEGLHKNLKMSGGYDTFGNIFFLNLKSKGNFIFENKNVQAYHLVRLLPSRKKGHVDMDLDFQIRNIGKTRMTFKDSTLPPQASAALMKLVNDNWKQVTKAVTPTLEDAIAQVFTKVLSPIFQRFPMSTLFPDKSRH